MRKTVLALTTILLFTINGFSQIKKGSIFIGGDLVFHSTNANEQNSTNNFKSRSFGISPVFGLVVRDNLLAGIKLSYFQSKWDSNVDPVQKNYNWGGGLFLRKFKRIAESDFYIFIQGDLLAGFGEEMIKENTVDQVKITSRHYNLGFYPGLNYQLSKKFLLETGLSSFFQVGYSHYERVQGTANPVKTTYNNFGISTSLSGLNQFYVGIKILLSR